MEIVVSVILWTIVFMEIIACIVVVGTVVFVVGSMIDDLRRKNLSEMRKRKDKKCAHNFKK